MTDVSYAIIDEMAVEISDWESAEARERMMQSQAMHAFAPLFELLAAPPVPLCSSNCATTMDERVVRSAEPAAQNSANS